MANNQQISAAEEALKREFEQEVLNRLRKYLCDHLEPERFFPYLQQRNYLDTESCDEIRSARTTRSRVNKMLDILIRHGRRPLIALTKAIEKSSPTQKFIAKRLREEHEMWIKRTENVTRLESAQQIQEDCPTARYHGCYDPSPPPYQPYSGPVHTMPPSHFSLPESELPKPIPHVLNTSLIPYTPMMSFNQVPPPSSRSRSPGYSSYVSSFGPSHFRTIDLETVSHNYDPSLRDQFVAERKIPPPLGGVEAPSLDEKIYMSQQKELQRYESQNHDSASSNWPRSPRTPSEHEVPSNDHILLNGTDTEPTEANNSTVDIEVPMRPLRFQLSCQSQSFQPSSFNYSSENDQRQDNGDLAKDFQRRTTSSPRTNPSTRDYSSPLETIRSGEVLGKLFTSLPGHNVSHYIRNPTEHTDASMMSQNDVDDEGEIPLEISEASMN